MARSITTEEELLRAGDIGRCELVRGRLVMMVPPAGHHGRVTNEIAYRLTGFVRSRGTGTVFAEIGFRLSGKPDTVRAPDVAFLRRDRAPMPARGYYPGAPDLAVEVLSPHDRPGEVRDKVAEWLAAGTLAVWVVDPRARTVAVHEPGEEDKGPQGIGKAPGRGRPAGLRTGGARHLRDGLTRPTRAGRRGAPATTRRRGAPRARAAAPP